MKRVLIITRNFPPLVGGMERLVFNIYTQLSTHFNCDIVGPTGSGVVLQNGMKAWECRPSPVSVFIVTALLKSFRATARNKYQVCIAGSGVTALIAVIISWLRGIPSITFIHGLDLIANNRIYQKIFVPFIKYSDVVVANSHNTAQLAEKAGVPVNKIIILHPGVDRPEEIQGHRNFRESHNLQDKSLLLSVGRLIPRKGLAEFIRNSLPAVVRQHNNTAFVIIGSEPEDALDSGGQVLKDIKAAIAETGLEQHVILVGQVEESILQAAYREADFFIFPLREMPGDVEGFGMVAVEAAAFGLPTIAFSEGGVSDAVKQDESGFLVTPGDYDAFSNTMINCLNKTVPAPSPASCRAFAERFNWNHFGDRLHHIVNSTSAQASLESE
jgi:phosphatidylinositol alpha-1,6-mannosyltransferase